MVGPVRISLATVALFALAAARPGARSLEEHISYPSEDENIIPDYAYDNDQQGKSESAYVGGNWKSFFESSAEEKPSHTNVLFMPPDGDGTMTVRARAPAETEATSTAPETTPTPPLSGTTDVARAVDVAGSVGAAAAVHAVEVVVKAALQTTTEVPDDTMTTTEFAEESGRSAGAGIEDEKPMGDAPTADQSLYGFSKFLHDLLQVPVQVMRSVSSYLSGALNGSSSSSSRQDTPSTAATSPDDALTSAMLSQSF